MREMEREREGGKKHDRIHESKFLIVHGGMAFP